MSNVVNASDPLVSSEITMIANLLALGASGSGQFIQKTGATTFQNASTVGSGMLTPPESVNGTRTIFTVVAQPKFIISEQGLQIETFGYTYSPGSITMNIAPVQFVRYFI